MLKRSVAIICLATPLTAHEFTSVETAGFREVGHITVIEMQNTVAGERVVCALYDNNGEMLASTSTYTDNLATQAVITGNFETATEARCVLS